MAGTITSDRIREELTQLILSGELPPGHILRENLLAERFGVSRTPIREAIRQVAATGLITLRPHQRSIVCLIGMTEALERFETMGVLEASCAELSAIKRSEADLTAILTHHEACAHFEKADDVAAYFEANEDFHTAIYRSGGNRHLAEHTLEMRRMMHVLRRPRVGQPRRMHGSFAEHCRIVDAIRDRDPAEARAAMLDHVAMQGETLREFVEHYEKLSQLSQQEKGRK